MNSSLEPDARRRQIGTVLVALQFMLIAALLAKAVLAAAQHPVTPWAWGCALAGVLLGGWALTANGIGNFNIRPTPRAGGVLAQSGPYRLIRHPMYSAVLLCAVAAALASASTVGWVLCAALAVVLGAKATIEERWMLSAHPAYADYRQRSKRFIPMLW